FVRAAIFVQWEPREDGRNWHPRLRHQDERNGREDSVWRLFAQLQMETGTRGEACEMQMRRTRGVPQGDDASGREWGDGPCAPAGPWRCAPQESGAGGRGPVQNQVREAA